MEKKLSIIIPVYNVEEYVRRCLLSVVTQDVSPDDYEVIAVNDGSTDSSREILTSLQQEYPFIRIVDKENGGLSSARNAGLEYASGRYVFFLDSDDWIGENAMNFLLGWIDSHPADIMMFGVAEIYDDGKQVSLATNLSPDNKIMPSADYLCNYTVRSSGCMSLFLRDLFVRHNITMKEGYLSEDDDFIIRIFSVAQKIVCNDYPVYYYYQRSNSLSKGREHARKLIEDKTDIIVELAEYVEKFDGDLRKGLERKLDFLTVDTIRLLIRKGQPEEMFIATLNKLRQIKYYPLRKASYSSKYKLFRFLFNHSLTLNLLKPFRNYI